MPKLFFSILFLLIVFVTSVQDIKKVIAQAKADYNAINHYKGYQVVTIDAPSGRAYDGGEKLTGCFKGATLCKITYSVGLSYALENREYYLKNGQPFFILVTEYAYAVKLGGSLNYHSKKAVYEGRYYMSNKKVIHRIIKGQHRMEDTPADYDAADVQRYRQQLLKKVKQQRR